MTFELKLFILLFILIAVIRFARSQPDKFVSRVLFTWYGPFPQEGELECRFALRWAAYSFKWFFVLLLIFVSGSWLLNEHFKGFENQYLEVIFFMLGFLMLMAFVAGLGLLFKATCLHVSEHKKVFDSSNGDFVEKTQD